MAYQMVELNCPGCNEPNAIESTQCACCGRELFVSSFNSVYDMPMPMVNKCAGNYRKALAQAPDDQNLNTSLAMCYLKLKLYDQALPAFEKAMEDNFDNSEAFFYAAVCVLKGRKPFLLVRAEIDKAIEYIKAALMIEPRGIYYYFLAYIKYDYFHRKFFKITPTYQQELATAMQLRYSPGDAHMLFDLLGVEKPNGF